jgi:translocation protein SEC63
MSDYSYLCVITVSIFGASLTSLAAQLKVEDLSALSEEEQMEEDDISDPDEDTLAGQMAAMRGEKVKRSPYHGDDDDESSTDDDQSDGDGTDSSDSDSD